MACVTDESAIAHRYRLLAPHLTERELRIWAAAEANAYGKDGVAALARITGIPSRALSRTQRELAIKPATNAAASQTADPEH